MTVGSFFSSTLIRLNHLHTKNTDSNTHTNAIQPNITATIISGSAGISVAVSIPVCVIVIITE